MKFKVEDIIKYADKLLIGLSEDEANMILSEFDEIDKNIDLINQIDGIEKIEPAFMPYDLYVASLRDDEVEKSVDVDLILKNCKDVLGREVKVPKVVGNE